MQQGYHEDGFVVSDSEELDTRTEPERLKRAREDFRRAVGASSSSSSASAKKKHVKTSLASVLVDTDDEGDALWCSACGKRTHALNIHFAEQVRMPHVR